MQNFDNIRKVAKFKYVLNYGDFNIAAISDDHAIVSILWETQFSHLERTFQHVKMLKTETIDHLDREMKNFLRGKIQKFTVNTLLLGTEFQKKVWNALLHIPYGATMSYGDFARLYFANGYLGAISGNMGRNPLPVLYPCHRVVGKNNTIGGFSGGVPLKKYLLNVEMHFTRR